jgi:membrane-associated protein
MEWLSGVMDLFLHVDKHLDELIRQCGSWTYLVLFVVIFCETGLVVTPFLPGDSLLFAAGALAGRPESALDPTILFLVLSVAAILGDTVNYWLGNYIGPRAFSGNVRFLKKKYLDRTHAFYERHGGKTIILARFVPIVRTFAPFVAGIGAMSYGRFLAYNVLGGVVWVALFVYGGYFFGTWRIVQENFSLVVLAIVLLSVLPMIIEFLKAYLTSRRTDQRSAEPGDGQS